MPDPRDAEIEDLRLQVAYLKSELGLQQSATNIEELRVALGITRCQALVLELLRSGRGRVITRLQIEDSLAVASGEHGRRYSARAVDVHVCHLRKRLGRDIVAAAGGGAFRITREGLNLIAAALEERQAA